MKTEFVLRIDIANAATQGDANVADILRSVAEKVAFLGINDNTHYNVKDANGNEVGRYGRYSEPEPDDEEEYADLLAFYPNR